jgi:hypothetical protein
MNVFASFGSCSIQGACGPASGRSRRRPPADEEVERNGDEQPRQVRAGEGQVGAVER